MIRTLRWGWTMVAAASTIRKCFPSGRVILVQRVSAKCQDRWVNMDGTRIAIEECGSYEYLVDAAFEFVRVEDDDIKVEIAVDFEVVGSSDWVRLSGHYDVGRMEFEADKMLIVHRTGNPQVATDISEIFREDADALDIY